MPTAVAPGLMYWTRGEVSLPPRSAKVTDAHKTEYIQHHSDKAAKRTDFVTWVREIYHQHTVINGWYDIAYNFLVMTDRKPGNETVHIIEGRGWGGVGSHTIGHNTVGLGVCYLRNGDITVGVERAINWIYARGCEYHRNKLKAFSHCNVYSTECPGSDLKSWVKAGMHVGPSTLIEATNMIKKPAVAIAWTPSGNGYYIFAADGGVFSFGDAVFHGSMGGKELNEPITGAAVHPSGQGYVLVGADGGTFAFGNAMNWGNALKYIS